MPPPNDSPKSSPELEELRASIAELSARVSQLEARLGALSRAQVSEPRALPIETAAGTQARLESRFSLTIVNRVGAITLALGIIFFFKYAVDNRWVGPEARVIIGLLAGLGMIGGAEWVRSRGLQTPDQSIFLQGIAGCGLATVYVASYASFSYYKLIIPAAGFLFLVTASALAIVLSLRYQSAAIAALGFTGALLAPLLLHGAAPQVWLDFPFLLLVPLTALWLAMRRQWPVLIPLISSLAIIAAAILLGSRHAGLFLLFAALLALAHFGAAAREGSAERVKQIAYIAGHGCLLIGLLRAVALWSEYVSSRAERGSVTSEFGSVLLGVYGGALLLFGVRQKRPLDRTLSAVFLGMVMVKLYLWDVWQLGRFYRITAFVLLGMLLLGASYVYSRYRSHMTDR